MIDYKVAYMLMYTGMFSKVPGIQTKSVQIDSRRIEQSKQNISYAFHLSRLLGLVSSREELKLLNNLNPVSVLHTELQ